MKKWIALVAFSLLFMVNSACVKSGDPLQNVDPMSPHVNKIVFVTSQKYKGDMSRGLPTGGGVRAADEICQEQADRARLGGTFKAWISDSRRSPSTWAHSQPLTHYRLVDGTIIAKSWAELTSGNLKAFIDKDQYGENIKGTKQVWTGTSSTGMRNPKNNMQLIDKSILDNCNDWTSSSPAHKAKIGTTHYQTEGYWSSLYHYPCHYLNRLYCIQQ